MPTPTWYAVVDAQGEAVSFGTVLADPLPAGLEAVAIDHQPGEDERWDPDTRTVVAVSDEERLVALAAQRDALDAEISALEAKAKP